MKRDNSIEEELLEVDDNRQIADMNVEGMPWYVDKKRSFPNSGDEKPPLSKKEMIRLMFGATTAALLIAGVIIFVMFLFILFCIHIWF